MRKSTFFVFLLLFLARGAFGEHGTNPLPLRRQETAVARDARTSAVDPDEGKDTDGRSLEEWKQILEDLRQAKDEAKQRLVQQYINNYRGRQFQGAFFKPEPLAELCREYESARQAYEDRAAKARDTLLRDKYRRVLAFNLSTGAFRTLSPDYYPGLDNSGQPRAAEILPTLQALRLPAERMAKVENVVSKWGKVNRRATEVLSAFQADLLDALDIPVKGRSKSEVDSAFRDFKAALENDRKELDKKLLSDGPAPVYASIVSERFTADDATTDALNACKK